MWLKKSNERIQAEKTKSMYSLSGPIIVFIFTFVMISILLVSDSSRGIYHNPVLKNLSEYLKYSPIIFFGSIPLSIYVFHLQLKYKRSIFSPIKEEMLICNLCYQLKSNDDITKCNCGGIFEYFKYYEWLSGEKLNLYENSPLKYESSKIKEIKIPLLISLNILKSEIRR